MLSHLQNHTILVGLLLSLIMGLHAAPAQSQPIQVVTVTVSALDHDAQDVPLSVEVTANQFAVTAQPVTPCQEEPTTDPNKVRLTWIAHDLKKGEAQTYYLAPTAYVAPNSGIELKRNGANVDFFIDGKLFTRYDTTTGPNKPYFYPVNAPTGAQIVRHWPVEQVGQETHDHPHHRGLWFTHSSVNGVDFWTEVKGTGKTVHTGYIAVQSGPVYGLMQTTTDWITPDGKKIAEDKRDIRVYHVSNGYLMDFSVTVQAVGGPLVWGDDKDGTLGLRLADSMRAALEKNEKGHPEGHIINANGLQQAAAWGKPANWCDYYGPLAGQTVGVAIFDDPHNIRHPTPWHVRDYGLFAANPFGLHAFDNKQPREAGQWTTPEGQSITFRYRLFFHTGTTTEAHIAAVWDDFATPPEVKVAAQ